LAGAASEAGLQVRIQHVPGLLTPFFSSRPVERYSQAAACDLERYGIWCRALLERGVYPPPSQFEAWFPSLAHGEAEVARTVEAARGAFDEVAAA
jgi:glutamate-1-semialdehyde 2,1-aminomutase